MSFIQTIIAWFLTPAMPLYFGGKGGSSQANTSTATTTATSSVNTDQSMMGGDNAVGLNGNSNIVDKSVVNNTAFNDTSDNSTKFTDNSDRSSTTAFSDSSNNSTNFSDSSNHSTYFSDSSDKSTNFSDSSVKSSSTYSMTSFLDSSNRSTNTTTTDFGSVSKALDGMGKLSDSAMNLSGQIVKDGMKGLADQSKDNIAVLEKAFAFASKSSAADAQKYTDVLGFAKDSIAKTSAAYADAKDGGQNKTLLIAAVATVGAVGLAFALKG